MDQFLNNLSSLSWWLSVVLVGIFINFFTDYLKPKIDSWLGTISSRYNEINKKREQEKATEIEKLRKNSELLLYNSVRSNTYYIRSTVHFVTGVGSFLLANAIISQDITLLNFFLSLGFYIAGTVYFVLAQVRYTQGARLRKKVEEAAKQSF